MKRIGVVVCLLVCGSGVSDDQGAAPSVSTSSTPAPDPNPSEPTASGSDSCGPAPARVRWAEATVLEARGELAGENWQV